MLVFDNEIIQKIFFHFFFVFYNNFWAKILFPYFINKCFGTFSLKILGIKLLYFYKIIIDIINL